jgi:hypothetical protein
LATFDDDHLNGVADLLGSSNDYTEFVRQFARDRFYKTPFRTKNFLDTFSASNIGQKSTPKNKRHKLI